jgi:hypothetical protein
MQALAARSFVRGLEIRLYIAIMHTNNNKTKKQKQQQQQQQRQQPQRQMNSIIYQYNFHKQIHTINEK